jgi:hypothetical protein
MVVPHERGAEVHFKGNLIRMQRPLKEIVWILGTSMIRNKCLKNFNFDLIVY